MDGKTSVLSAVLVLSVYFQCSSSTWCWQKPLCYCTSWQKISCNGVRNLWDIRGLLREHPKTQRLVIKGSFDSIPRRVFAGFSTVELKIQAPLRESTPADGLSEIGRLRNITFQQTLFAKVPSVLSASNLETYQLLYGCLSEVGLQFQNKSAAIHIVLSNNEISRVRAEAFVGTVNLEVLDLSWNKIASLDPETFSSLKVLKVVRLQHNFLSTVGGYFKELSPEEIDLYGNNLISITDVFHRGMWTMLSLDLGGNPHLQLSDSDFNATMLSLHTFRISDNEMTTIKRDLLRFFPALRHFSMSGNNLTHLPKGFFRHTPYLTHVVLSDNKLQSIDGLFQDHRKWYTLLLDGNQIEDVASNGSVKANSIDLSRNRIRSFLNENAESLSGVTSLNLSSNNIQELNADSFSSILNLRSLDLSNNPLKSLNGSTKNLKNLTDLYLSSAHLESLSADELTGSSKIKKINLHNNSLSTLHKAFIYQVHLTSLDVSANNLTTLMEDAFHPTRLQLSVGISHLQMANNSWSCDCRLSWVARWLNQRSSHLEDEPVCSSPDHLQGLKIRDLNETDFERWVSDCPPSCSCYCQSADEDIGTKVDCSSKKLTHLPSTFPSNVWTMDMSFNSLESFDGAEIQTLKQLKTLNLENNKIKNLVNLSALNHVSTIHLCGNELGTFPLEDWVAQTQVSLSKNPWRCDCSTWDFRNWLVKHKDLVLDLMDIRCGPEEKVSLRGEPIASLSKVDLCTEVPVWEIILIAVGSFFIILCVWMCFIWRQTLLSCCYFYGCSCLKTTPSRQVEMSYDAFLLYSDEEHMKAVEITRYLEEGKYHFDLCIPCRDIPIPRTAEKVSAYMLQCSKLIVLVSRKFLENEMQMNLLKSSSIGFTAKNIICVMCQRLPKQMEIDPIVAIFLRDGVQLHWDQCFFWKRLIYQLPKKKWSHNQDELLVQ